MTPRVFSSCDTSPLSSSSDRLMSVGTFRCVCGVCSDSSNTIHLDHRGGPASQYLYGDAMRHPMPTNPDAQIPIDHRLVMRHGRIVLHYTKPGRTTSKFPRVYWRGGECDRCLLRRNKALSGNAQCLELGKGNLWWANNRTSSLRSDNGTIALLYASVDSLQRLCSADCLARELPRHFG